MAAQNSLPMRSPIDIHVRGGAGTRLKNIERKMRVEPAINNSCPLAESPTSSFLVTSQRQVGGSRMFLD